MFRFLGFLGGLIFQFVFGLKEVRFFFIWGILNMSFIFLTFLFRFLCRYSLNFQVTFAQYLQSQFMKAIDCFCGMTVIPQTTYKVTTYYSDGSKTKHTETTNNTFWWGIIEAFVFFLISFVSPILLLFIVFLYFLTFIRIYQGYGQKKMQEILKAKRQYEQTQRNQISQLPNNVYIQKNNQLIPINNMTNATVTVYNIPKNPPPPPSNRDPLINPNYYHNGPPPLNYGYVNNTNSNYPPYMPTYSNMSPNYNAPPNINYSTNQNMQSNPYQPQNPITILANASNTSPIQFNNNVDGKTSQNINYVPMPQSKVKLDTTNRNLVIQV